MRPNFFFSGPGNPPKKTKAPPQRLPFPCLPLPVFQKISPENKHKHKEDQKIQIEQISALHFRQQKKKIKIISRAGKRRRQNRFIMPSHTNNHAFLSTCELWAAGTNSRVKNLFFTLTFTPPPGGTNHQWEERRISGVLSCEKDLPSANRRTSKSTMLTLRNSLCCEP